LHAIEALVSELQQHPKLIANVKLHSHGS